MGAIISCCTSNKKYELGSIRPVPIRRPVSSSELKSVEKITPEYDRETAVETGHGLITSPITSPEHATYGTLAITRCSTSSTENAVETGAQMEKEYCEKTFSATSDDRNMKKKDGELQFDGELEVQRIIQQYMRVEQALVHELSQELEDVDDSFNTKVDEVEVGFKRVESESEHCTMSDEGLGLLATSERKSEKDMLDVRSLLPVRAQVIKYEMIEAEARVDPEQVVRSAQ